MTVFIADERNTTQTLNDHLVVEQSGIVRAGPTAIDAGNGYPSGFTARSMASAMRSREALSLR